MGTGTVTAVASGAGSGVGSGLDPGAGSGLGSTEGLAPGVGSVAGEVGWAGVGLMVFGTVVPPAVSGLGSMVGSLSGAGVNVGTAHAIDKAIAKPVKTPAINSLIDSGRWARPVWEARDRPFRIRIVA